MNLNKRTLIRIRKERERKNISQQAVAKQLHISVSAYSRLENGEVALTLDMIEKISHALLIPMAGLLDLETPNRHTSITIRLEHMQPLKLFMDTENLLRFKTFVKGLHAERHHT